ncbi:MAG: ATP-binding cassette domain-containing protein [Acidobacteriota bacterium]|nr:ATP-binding cassette domain-containing protein [Acidobacteriota bacterium]
MPIAPLIIKGLYFSYPKFQVFTDFNFCSRAKIIILKGPSGCGKTTLLKLISRILVPDSVAKFEVDEKSCYIVQEDSLLPWLSGTDNIHIILGIKSEQITSHPMYKLVGKFINQKAYTMSYGQRRLIEIFRAVLYKPSLLCLDEPLNFLDPVSRQSVVNSLNAPELNETRIILSTHHSDELDAVDAETYAFDGLFPIIRLNSQNEKDS